MLTKPNQRIGDVLVQLGMAKESQLDEAQEMAGREGIRIGEALVRMGVLDRARLAWALGVHFEVAHVDLSFDMIDWPFLRRFPLARLRELRLLPLSASGRTVDAVVADPAAAQLESAAAEMFAGRELVVQLADEEQILAIIEEAERQLHTPEDFFAPPPGAVDAHAWLDACIEALRDDTGGDRFVVLEVDDAHPHRFLVTRPVPETGPAAVAGVLARAIFRALPEKFAPEFHLPGGFAGMLHATGYDAESWRAPVRATLVAGAQGPVMVIERISRNPGTVDPPASYVVRTAQPSKLKHELNKFPGISIEARIDSTSPGPGRQFASIDPRVRVEICRRLSEALSAKRVCLEALGGEEAGVSACSGISGLFIIQHDPGATEPVVESSAGERQPNDELLLQAIRERFTGA